MMFVFNDTATTESYTYLHPLSQHDALPSLALEQKLIQQVEQAQDHTRYFVSNENTLCYQQPGMTMLGVLASNIEGRNPINGPRSEEHTSKLQSQLRHSYADFCLKKKTQQQT